MHTRAHMRTHAYRALLAPCPGVARACAPPVQRPQRSGGGKGACRRALLAHTAREQADSELSSPLSVVAAPPAAPSPPPARSPHARVAASLPLPHHLHMHARTYARTYPRTGHCPTGRGHTTPVALRATSLGSRRQWGSKPATGVGQLLLAGVGSEPCHAARHLPFFKAPTLQQPRFQHRHRRHPRRMPHEVELPGGCAFC